MTQRYKIANHLTGVMFYGPTLDGLGSNEATYEQLWKEIPRSELDVGWNEKYILADQEFFIVEETQNALYLENVNTGIKFWIGSYTSEYAVKHLQRIPV
jgi:hypothetical protein